MLFKFQANQAHGDSIKRIKYQNVTLTPLKTIYLLCVAWSDHKWMDVINTLFQLNY